MNSRLPAFVQEPVTDWSPLAGDSLTGLDGQVSPGLAGYMLERRLGNGRHSSVWLARRGENGPQVALKLAETRGTGQAFAHEFELAAMLAHPNIVGMIEQGSAGGLPFLAMEYAAGGTLAAHMGRAHEPAAALQIVRQAAEGLAVLHARALVHRDVKPANFLLRADGSLVLADFGLVAATGTQDTTRPGALYGTPRYVAPEQLRGERAAPAADVYSLGVLLCELLTGRPPFAGETLMEVLSQHLVAAPPPLPDTLAAWQPLADAMLAKQAADRLPDAQSVLERIAALLPAAPQHPAPARMTGMRWLP